MKYIYRTFQLSEATGGGTVRIRKDTWRFRRKIC